MRFTKSENSVLRVQHRSLNDKVVEVKVLPHKIVYEKLHNGGWAWLLHCFKIESHSPYIIVMDEHFKISDTE